MGDAREFLHQVSSRGVAELSANLAEVGREQKQRGQLRSECFGRSHADLRAGVRGNGAAGLARNHGTDDVANRQRGRAFEFCLALGREGVRCFTRLADADGQGVAVDDGIAIAEFASVIHFHGQASKALDHEFSG